MNNYVAAIQLKKKNQQHKHIYTTSEWYKPVLHILRHLK